MKRRRHLISPPDEGLKAPKKKYKDTFSAETMILDWLKKEGATESRTFDEETGAPMRTFTIKL